MSAILKRTKKMYRKVILIELLCFITATLLIICYQINDGIAFALGVFSIFVPQCALIFFVYFRRQSQQNMQNMTALYQGEAIKFAITIVLMAGFFSLYQTMNYIFFFVGFIVALVLNNLLPIYFKQKENQKQNVFN
ncbi:ATP synthase protein I [Cricetibacter osteomyelitidis]|uniref:ATP synthase protein I n=1 Tax=Cricetibacter osteomyelitidis TaxID=1521931 RepID=A0A4R2TQJ9_9PAST|nr:ATP synthase subunit I [Cricetibacter osteomyelitidis]TCP97292.1 ATP synthase protein I [Cricetibacter osteomyelitidis]